MKKLISTVFSCALALLVFACHSENGGDSARFPLRQTNLSAAESGSVENPIILNLGYGSSKTNPRHIVASAFADWVHEETAGRVTIKLFPAEILGTDTQMTELLSIGNLDMCITAHGALATYEPKLAVLELPFLFDSPEKASHLLDGPVGQELAANLPSREIRLLAYWENGLRQITNNLHAVNSPADLQGLKIRGPENIMSLDIFRALGTRPVPLAFPQLYPSLSQHIVDGQENPLANIYAARFYEVQKYLALTNHKYESCPLIINEQRWQSLDAEVQAVLADGAVKFARQHRALVREEEAEILSELEARGMEISRPDLAPFVKVSGVVYEKYEKVFGKDLIDRIRAAVQ